MDLDGRIAGLTEETGRIEQESEGVYLALGRLFPQLASETSRSSENAEKSLQAFSALAGTGSAGSGLRAVSAFAEGSSAFFRALHDRDAAFLLRVEESVGRLASLDESIVRVRQDSEEMEIISLNAMTVALKSGAAGKAFSVITDELKRLSGRTIALTEEVTGRGRVLLESFSRLSASLGELDAFQRTFFVELDATLNGGIRTVQDGILRAADFFGGLLAEAREVGVPVSRVMREIQLQDIVRQSLQHVGLSLAEAARGGRERPGEAGERAFAAAVAELCGSLVEDVVAKLDASASSFEADMDAVRAIVGSCERKRSDFLGGAASSLGRLDATRISQSSARYLDLKRGAVASARRLAAQVKALDESFKGLAGLLSRFQTIVVASRIEVAKTRALGNVATTVQGMILLTDRIEADVAGAMGTTKDFIKGASAAIAGYAAAEEGESERLLSTLGRVEEDIGKIESARASVAGAIEVFSLYTPEFISLIREARDRLGELGALSSRLRQVKESIAGLGEDLRAELGPGASEASGDRLRRMVERFTIFTHKKAAGEIGRFEVEVEEGAEAGEVTLF